jgi:hypothetical protein
MPLACSRADCKAALVCKCDEVNAALCNEANRLLKVLAHSETFLIFDPGEASVVKVRL